VDLFVLSYGIKTLWKNQDTLYCIPGEILFTKTNQQERGIFTYCIDKSGQLYHRHFTIKTTELLIETIIQQTFKEVDFPEVHKAYEMIKAGEVWQNRSISSQEENEPTTFNPFSESLTIHDRKNEAVLTLFKSS